MNIQPVKRDQTAVADVKTRLREPLRAKLERAARHRGVSMNAEICDRLERSFQREEEFGGLEGRGRAHLALSAFNTAGARWARERGVSGAWENDPECYLVAALAAAHSLMIGAPEGLDMRLLSLHVASFKAQQLGRIVNQPKRKGGKQS
jgi:Arc-like DNA binding domain